MWSSFALVVTLTGCEPTPLTQGGVATVEEDSTRIRNVAEDPPTTHSRPLAWVRIDTGILDGGDGRVAEPAPEPAPEPVAEDDNEEPLSSSTLIAEGARSPATAELPDGSRVHVWVDVESNRPRARIVDPEGTLGPVLDLGGAAIDAVDIAVTSDAGGAVHIAWSAGTGVYYARLADGEVAPPEWASNVELCGMDLTRGVSIEAAPDGGLVLAWANDMYGEGAYIMVARKHPGDAMFGVASWVSPTDWKADVGNPRLAVGPDGKAHVTWAEVSTDGVSLVRYAPDAPATDGPGVMGMGPVSTIAVGGEHPDIVVHHERAVVFWSQDATVQAVTLSDAAESEFVAEPPSPLAGLALPDGGGAPVFLTADQGWSIVAAGGTVSEPTPGALHVSARSGAIVNGKNALLITYERSSGPGQPPNAELFAIPND